MTSLRKGQRVRFLRDSLGASERGDLSRVLRNFYYGKGDEGTLAFLHPNQKSSPTGFKGWWYVEVDSKAGKPRKLYVSASPSMFELIK